MAVEEGEPELVKCIIKNGGNVNFVVKKDGPNKGRTPLMEAARRGHDKLAEILIKEDANPDIQDVRGKTALMYAAHRGELEVVNALIGMANHIASLLSVLSNSVTDIYLSQPGAGARTDIVDMDGRDARRIAQEMHYDEIVYVLNTVALTGTFFPFQLSLCVEHSHHRHHYRRICYTSCV